jgi:hypothetical protein
MNIHESRKTSMKHKALPLLLLVLFVATACATSTASSSTPPPTPTFAVIPTPTPVPHRKVGDTVTVDGLEVTLVSVKIVDPATIPQHEEIYPEMKSDQTFLVLKEHLKNDATTDQSMAGTRFYLSDEAGNDNFTVQLGDLIPEQSLGAPVAAGMQQTGGDVYIVPKSTHAFFWIFAPASGAQVVWDINV